ncbi:molybdopterin synthase catalytic subunit [Helicobacter cynogastricus]|uniref:molybdopterin synthase catalytic subunit n=1 Tax=Helicobacter cynogastricus TaxID=329937 RepID=UPI000CF0F4F0|nr:molybdenum cofactor biosynthesis protein MoaE [Helicobacter cynogastricus]
MLEVFDGALNTARLYSQWGGFCQTQNGGALCVFSGIVRAEGADFKGLSFDVYLPLLQNWFDAWDQEARALGVALRMAHSRGDVGVGQSSYMAGLISAHRKEALELYARFIEDFKHNAPIWKYELRGDQRLYAHNQSHPLRGSGLLA